LFLEDDSGFILAQEIFVKMFDPSHTHRSSSSSTSSSFESSTNAKHRFREQVIKLSKQNKKMHMLQCEISQNRYPAKHVVAGYIFKKSFGSTKLRHLLNLSNIHDPGNGILMYVSIEHHFDLGNICLMKKHSNDDYYTVKILWKDLEPLLIVEEGEKILGLGQSSQVYEETNIKSFKDLESIHVHLDGRYKRLICFHMHMAMKKNNIIDVDFDEVDGENLMNIMDFWSPEQEQINYVDKVERWFNSNSNQVQVSRFLFFR
jgi:hypothetical protein